ncbi:hypothetical protein H5V45_01950 [Nocardioides sp. KIGAM211]|uniref:Uncharacterized protein n=1 Tax=Nocardioides luti TaxID=2761101 RepID=A0A7X0RD32_9ACTN|nr:hypothetical protein [Nocardioides luti]MBB6626073.1 hypothetical protein [Nocardioides luti]
MSPRALPLTLAALLALALPSGAGAAGAAGAAAPTATTGRAAAPVTQVNDCWSTDNGEPVIDSYDVSPAVVDTDAGPVEVQLTVQAHDTGGPGPATGLRSVRFSLWAAQPYSGPRDGQSLDTLLTQDSDGSWHGSVTVPAHTGATYNSQITVVDGADEGTLSEAHLVYEQQQDVLTATGTEEFPDDTTAPTMTALSVSRTQVDTRRRAQSVDLEATVTDDDSGVQRVDVFLLRKDRTSNNGGIDTVTLTRVEGTDTFRGRVRFRRWLGNSQRVLFAEVEDRAGNTRRYRRETMAERGFASRIDVVSGPYNVEGPRVVRVLRAAPSIDVRRHGGWYAVRVLLADRQGIRAAQVRLATDNPPAQLHRVSGTDRRAVWAGRVHVRPCSSGPRTTDLHVRTWDRQGRTGNDHSRDVRLITRDLTPAWARSVWRNTPHVFTFDEPVHGISPTNVVVYDADAADPHQIAGTWACRNGAGSTVDCLTGPVIKATFTADDPDAPAPGAVDWSPDHHLDVLDRKGNPSGLLLSPMVLD